MNRMRMMITMLAASVVCLLFSSLAQAQASRTWVSGVGDDANPCSRTAPCKTFAGAISKTAAGGEINALDPGGFGAVTITKSITIDGGTGAGFASILAAGGNGVIINALSTDNVTLRNISINGANKTAFPGVNGIRILRAARVHIDNCTIFGFGTHGIDFNLATGVLSAKVTIQDTTIEECNNSGINAISISGNAVLSLERVRITGCGTGVNAGANTLANIHDSSLVHNVNGVVAASASEVVVESSNINFQSTTGIQVNASATVKIGGNLISRNPTGVANSGTCETTQDNRFLGNTNDTTGNALAPVLKK